MFGNLTVAAAKGSSLPTIAILVVFLVLMYFIMVRPQQKQQKKHREMMSQLKKGDHVVTVGRLHGVIDEINDTDKTATLDCDGIFLTFDLRAISAVSAQGPQAVAAPAEKEAEKEAPVESSDAEAKTDDVETSDSDSDAE
ncbi:preprotein translocase subunit YajC [Levilactobacillus huananensis]|uniref:preprotein translocase subunit YajC n=1 Tax=Levilactobacillus huananensis TaxID=2486019 RepID=UPI001CDC0044|nr:preprotein translocase subunit YajC [Levilactobacillus huananensis]